MEARLTGALAERSAWRRKGFVRATEDVDVLMTREGLAAFKAAWLARAT